MYITITTNAGTQTAEVANTESGLYEEIGKHLLDLPIPNRMTVTTPVGDAEYDITQRGTFVKDGRTVPSMYVKEVWNTSKRNGRNPSGQSECYRSSGQRVKKDPEKTE